MRAHNYRKYLEFLALCLLASALLWWFGRKLDWGQVRHAVRNSNPYLLIIATLIISVAYFARAFRWRALLRPLGPAGIADLFAATTIGFSAVFLVGRAGEVVRPVVLPMRDPGVRPTASFVTIMIERIYDLMAVILFFAINLLWFNPPAALAVHYAKIRTLGLVLLLGAIFGIALLTLFRRKSKIVIGLFSRLFERWQFIPRRLTKLVISTLEQLATALRVLVNFSELAETIAWTLVLWLGISFANMLVMRAFGLNFGLTESIFVLGFSLAGSLVPTPGGAAGAFHAATAAALIFLGVDTETAAAISIFIHLVDFGPATIFGFFYLIRGDLNLSKLRALTTTKAVEHVVEDEALEAERPVGNPRTFENVVGD